MDPNQFSPVGSTEEQTVSWISVCPMGLWTVKQKQIRKSSSCQNAGELQHPQLGSVCSVQVQVQTQTGDLQRAEPAPPDDSASASTQGLSAVLQVPLGTWTTLTVGEGQCNITEACLERMSSGDTCEILLVPLESSSGDLSRSFCATVQLKTFTPGKESWELTSEEKMNWVKSHKGKGSIRFRSADILGAADSYSRALKLLITLYGHVKEAKTPEEELECTQSLPESPALSVMEYKTIKAELHSNLSLCQLKLKQPERARANAAKATELCPSGAKAWYRLGQACQMVNELEEAKMAFKKLLELQPDSSAAIKALKEVAIKEKENNKQLAHRLSKMFN